VALSAVTVPATQRVAVACCDARRVARVAGAEQAEAGRQLAARAQQAEAAASLREAELLSQLEMVAAAREAAGRMMQVRGRTERQD
jgi:hypothetical protein